jgi:hypothetical protein
MIKQKWQKNGKKDIKMAKKWQKRQKKTVFKPRLELNYLSKLYPYNTICLHASGLDDINETPLLFYK